MDKKYIITIDFGTQSVRVAIVDSLGNFIAMHREKYNPPYFSKKIGYAEQDPEKYYEYLAKASKKLLSENKKYVNKIVGISMACLRDTAVVCDENMKPLRPAILWIDQRRAEAREKLPKFPNFLFKTLGLSHMVRLNRERTSAHWIKENEPEIWAKVKYYMTISTYITYKITNEYKDSIVNFSGHFPGDFKHRRFYLNDKNLRACIFGIPRRLLPQIVDVGNVIGHVTSKCSKETLIPEGLPFYSVGSDKSCETLGLGAMKKGIAAISCGTGSTIEITTKKYCSPAKFLPSYPSVIYPYFNCEMLICRGFWMLGWFSKQFAEKERDQALKINVAPEKILNEKLKDIPPGSNGLVLQPYWGPGLARPLSRGSIVGFSVGHTKAHLYRAIIEGIYYELKEGLIGMEKSSRTHTTEIRISGGGSQQDEVCQICADVFNLPVKKVQTVETSSLGAAIAGFIASGVYKDLDEAVNNMVKISKTFMPNKEHVKKYEFLFNKVYLKMFPALKKIYETITLEEERDLRKIKI